MTKNDEFINNKDFRKFILDIKPILDQLEENRKKVYKGILLIGLVSPIISLIIFIISYILIWQHTFQNENPLNTSIWLVFIYFLIFYVVASIIAFMHTGVHNFHTKYYYLHKKGQIAYEKECTDFIHSKKTALNSIFDYIFSNNGKKQVSVSKSERKALRKNLMQSNESNTKTKQEASQYLDTKYISANDKITIATLVISIIAILYCLYHFIVLPNEIQNLVPNLMTKYAEIEVIENHFLQILAIIGVTIGYLVATLGSIIIVLLGILYFIFMLMPNINKMFTQSPTPLLEGGIRGFFKRLGYVDDKYQDTYNNLDVRLQETVFIGNNRMVILDFYCPKKVKGIITLKNKKFLFPNLKGEKISMESPEYEKNYTTTAIGENPQVEARCFLTTAFLDRATKLAEQGIEIACSFEGHKACIMMKAKRNLFEFSVFKNVLKKSSILNPIWEIKEVLSIIDTLKLEENIGL